MLATVLDRKTGSEGLHNEVVNVTYPSIPVHDYMRADVSSVSDYYPGGMPIKERTWVPSLVSKYKFGYQQQPKDDEIYGDGMSYAYKYRMEDVRLNRFWSVDPLTASYSYNSSYAYSENRLLDRIELEGAETQVIFRAQTRPLIERGSEPRPSGGLPRNPMQPAGAYGPAIIYWSNFDPNGSGNQQISRDITEWLFPTPEPKLPDLSLDQRLAIRSSLEKSSSPYERITNDHNNLTDNDITAIADRIARGEATAMDRILGAAIGAMKGTGRGASSASQNRGIWPNASRNAAINKFTPGAKAESDGQKLIYYNNNYIILYDKEGDYFRIQDTAYYKRRNCVR